MYNIRWANKNDIPVIADFIADCNSEHVNHIGYCGTNYDEIASSLEKDPELPLSFSLLYYKDELVALLGYDYYDSTAELWGPFVKNSLDFHIIVDLLWNNMIKKVSKDTIFQGFPNIHNKLCQELYKVKGMGLKGNHEVLERVILDKSHIKYNLLKEDDYNQFINLHDNIFPGTYYSGNDIISMLDEDNAVVVSKQDNKLVGYSYINVDAALDGNIEFIGVNPINRREGHGLDLLNMALGWFAKRGTQKLILCVDSKNTKAISLYKKSGFKTKHSLEFYRS